MHTSLYIDIHVHLFIHHIIKESHRNVAGFSESMMTGPSKFPRGNPDDDWGAPMTGKSIRTTSRDEK